MQKNYACTFEGCKAVFAQKGNLKIHARSHTGEKPFACTFEGCQCSFKTSSHLKNHMCTHTGERPYLCKFEGCEASFTTSTNLKTHMRRHTGEKPYRCTFEGCEATFTESGGLQQHMRSHTGEKPFVCSFEGCEAAFAQSSSLKIHMRRHTGDKRHVCTYEGCRAAFVKRGDLNTHLRTHTGEKPFVCTRDDCQMAFTQNSHLEVHLRTHTGEKPFSCTYDGCAYKSTTSGHLKNHIRAMHTLEGQARQKKQEQRIANVLDAAGIDYKREHHIDFTCMGDADNSFARIDFVFMRFGRIVFLEVDEEQHRFGYGKTVCDMKRMTKIIESLRLEGNSMEIVFLRYNPNAFTVDYKYRKVLKREREAMLVSMLQDAKHAIFTTNTDVIIQYMYYDTVSDYAEIIHSADYNQQIRECCLSTIV